MERISMFLSLVINFMIFVTASKASSVAQRLSSITKNPALRDRHVELPRIVRKDKSFIEPQYGSGDESGDVNDCPPWFLPQSTSTLGDEPLCGCAGRLREIVNCDEQREETSVALNYCMTLDEDSQQVVVGLCPFTLNFVSEMANGLFIRVPNNISELNQYTCGPLNREGVLCNSCRPGFGLSSYSLDLTCANCTENQYGWAWYIFTDFVLQTVFFVIVIAFRINITTAQLNSTILFFQIIGSTGVGLLVPRVLNSLGHSKLALSVRVYSVFADFWNLEFFTSVVPHSCISQRLSSLNIVALRYASAFYPLVFILLVYLFIKLRDRNYKPFTFVHILLKPFHKCKAKFRNYYDLKHSTIHAFATFLLLSYNKVANVSYSLLDPSQLYNASGDKVGPRLWYYDASVKLFQGNHIPYAILALVILALFIVLPPLILFLYPFKTFHRVLRKCKINTYALYMFIDAFQGHYKNGTRGSRDYRFFAGLYFVVRIAYICIRLLATYGWHWAIVVVLFVFAMVLIAVFQPYNQKYYIYNIVDVIILGILALLFHMYLIVILHASLVGEFPKVLFILMILVSTIPLLYFVCLIVYHLVKAVKIPMKWKNAIRRTKPMNPRKWWCFKKKTRHELNSYDLPDRFLRPELYVNLTNAS